ncbi:hypothetical protein BJ166DRAFT_211942 [Pestalotiopsis sp. NC0098]|nr:hypothetical protein BJ166DRAFT_211942 [Pestalotiopsis sp. NC0098]
MAVKIQPRLATKMTHEIDSFYLYWPSGMALWSYDAVLRTTQAICIPRQSNTIREGGEIFSHIALIANEQQNLIDNAWFLQMIFASDLATWIDEVLLRERWNIRSIEGSTGHGMFLPVEGPPDLKELMKSSRTIGFSVSALANVMRQNDLAVELLQIDEILESLPATATCMRAAPSFATTTPGQAAEDDFKQVILLLRSQMIARKRDVQYLQERARNQSSVLFSLISQKDTEASIDIASAAKDDSESMKVIAVMTMFFLPGTFFATLFAVPTLHWTDDQVVSNRFWVYWVFALPSTALIVFFYKGWQRFRNAPAWFRSVKRKLPF